jgi:putative transposase
MSLVRRRSLARAAALMSEIVARQCDTWRALPGFDGILREPEYGDEDVRRVRRNGENKLDGKYIYVNAALAGEPVGLAEAESYWTVS